jgi:Zn-dependent protease with chaperone function
MRACDIIVEGCNANQGTKAYGEWGNTALEACALGCAVVTHCLSQDKYREAYGCELGFTVANDEQALESALRRMADMPANDLMSEKERGRKWVEQHHSIPATANRLWDEVYKEFFS